MLEALVALEAFVLLVVFCNILPGLNMPPGPVFLSDPPAIYLAILPSTTSAAVVVAGAVPVF